MGRLTSPPFGSNGVADRIFVSVKGGPIGGRKRAVGVFVEALGEAGGYVPIDPALHSNILRMGRIWSFVRIK